jgi:hypothetical protein
MSTEPETMTMLDPRARAIPRPDVVEVIRRVAKAVKASKAKKTKTQKLVLATAATTISTPRKQHKETEAQAQALEYYIGLGKDRTLAKVAEHFDLTPDCINQWSHRLAWSARVRAIENRDIGQIIEDTGLQIVLERMRSMFIPDPIDMKKLILDPTASVGILKDLVTSFVNLDKNSRERKEDGEGGGQGSGKGKNQVMVNVIFET